MKNIFLLFSLVLVLSSCTFGANKDTTTNPGVKNPITNTGGQDNVINSGSITEKTNSGITLEEMGTGIVEEEVVLDIYNGKEVEDLINNSSFKQAQTLLNKESKDNVEILRLRSKLRVKEKKFEEALEFSLKANVLTKGKNKQFLYDIGVIYSNLGKLDESEKYIKEALIIDPKFNYAKDYLEIISKTRKIKTDNPAKGI